MVEDQHELDRYVVVTADAHCGGTMQEYREYLPRDRLAEFDAWAEGFVNPWEDLPSEHSKGLWSEEQRMLDMDGDGVAAEVLFPNTIPPFFPSHQLFVPMPTSDAEYELRWVGVQAHNRWLADFCARQPLRRAGMAQVFLNRPEDTVTEIRWAKEAGLSGVLVPSIAPNHPTAAGLWTDAYEDVWRSCEELDMVVNFHSGGGTPDFGTHPAAAAVLVTELQFYTRRSLWHLIWGGVFERFPELSVVITETGIEWAGQALKGLDSVYHGTLQSGSVTSRWAAEAMSTLSLTPSEYFQRNCHIGASFLPRHLVGEVDRLGVDRVMWGTDYPHDEGTSPHTIQALQHTFSDVPVEKCRLLLGGNAAEVYHFDLDALTRIAESIGPTLEMVHTPLETVPADALSAAFFDEHMMSTFHA